MHLCLACNHAGEMLTLHKKELSHSRSIQTVQGLLVGNFLSLLAPRKSPPLSHMKISKTACFSHTHGLCYCWVHLA